ncbi:MAG: hypothetical protein J1E60_00810 [Christensenellaceae bacterium]|nr:hypothetical protein [Christensenellaceae bacterium]
MKRTFAIIGDPVSHSRSPDLYAPMFRKFGIDADFLRLRVTPEELPKIREIVNQAGLHGFAVTMPHKRTILEYLDCISDSAKSAESANIITIKDNKLIGHNTDGDGLINALNEAGVTVGGRNVVILGGGGAALGANAAIVRNGGTVTFIKRSSGLSLNDAILAYEINTADVLINATPLGMLGAADFEDLSFVSSLKPSSAVVDMVYTDDGTNLIRAAKARGLNAIDGERILYHQGVLAFKLWTGFDYSTEMA